MKSGVVCGDTNGRKQGGDQGRARPQMGRQGRTAGSGALPFSVLVAEPSAAGGPEEVKCMLGISLGGVSS